MTIPVIFQHLYIGMHLGSSTLPSVLQPSFDKSSTASYARPVWG
jgi:hypothetical protein